MSKALALVYSKLQAFTNAAVELEHAFGQLESDDDQLAVARDYPFDKSFEELLHDIFEWRDSVQAHCEPIRCTACGTQREHLEVQRFITGNETLVCCEMVLDRNLEENACPDGPETCPKCGTPHSSTEFEDEGTGDEAGRTFHYCSDACREKH